MKPRRVHFKVRARFDMAHGEYWGSVTIYRDGGLVEVRRARSRKIYRGSLSALADRIVFVEVQQELRKKNLEKANRKLAQKRERALRRRARVRA